MNWLLKAAPLIGSIVVPLFGVIWKVTNDRKDPGAIRRMRRHSDLYGVLPGEAKDQLLPLIVHEARTYAAKNLRKVQRRLDGSAVAALIFFAVVTGLLLYPLISGGLKFWPLFILAGLVALLGLLFIIIGSQQIFKYDEAEPKAATSKPRPRQK